MKQIALILSAVLGLYAGGWERSGETVIDTEHARQWQDSAPAKEREGVWRDADKYCKSLDLEGFYDWRLPTREELQTLLAAEKAGRVTLRYETGSVYWSADICRIPINAWAVYWGSGHTFESDKCDEAHVRCVRDR